MQTNIKDKKKYILYNRNCLDVFFFLEVKKTKEKVRFDKIFPVEPCLILNPILIKPQPVKIITRESVFVVPKGIITSWCDPHGTLIVNPIPMFVKVLSYEEERCKDQPVIIDNRNKHLNSDEKLLHFKHGVLFVLLGKGTIKVFQEHEDRVLLDLRNVISTEKNRTHL